MATFRRVFTAAIVALALAAVAQAATSSSSAAASVRSTAYVKGGPPVGVTISGDPVSVAGMCRGLFATKGFTRCRAGGSRYQATACAWRITLTSVDGTSTILTVTTSRAMLAAIRPRVCPVLARYLRGYPGIRAVRLK